MTCRTKPLIAIVDDDASVCRALKRLLATHGIKAETFTPGRLFLEVMEALPTFQPVCVIVDMHMPGIHGLQVQARLACIRPHVPVLFLTGKHEAESCKNALAQGAVAFFRKPFQDDLDDFVRALRAILDIDGSEHK